MHGETIHDGDRAAFYRGALHALRFCDAREGRGRRFGAEAEALWRGFAGEMGASERIDLLLRDAEAQWPRAFAPREVFELAGLADDEPFGPAWSGLETGLADALWQEIGKGSAAPEVGALLASMATAWGHSLEGVDLPPVTSTSRLIVAGPSAIAAVIVAFAPRGELSWADQVLVVADQPLDRQLAGAAAAILGADRPTQVVRPHARPVRGFTGAALVLSKDVGPEILATARMLRGGA